MFELSIVIPTRNRADSLLKALMGIERSTHSTYELIVVDGASTDATHGVLMLATSIMGTRLRVIREAASVGFGAACNKGIAIARGRNVCILHDDVHPLDGALDAAIEQIDRGGDDSAIVALLSRPTDAEDVAVQRTLNGVTFAATHACGTLVAEFPLARRETFASVGFNAELKSSAAAIDFSLRAWTSGHTIVPALSSPLETHLAEAKPSRAAIVEREAIIAAASLPKTGTQFSMKSPCTLVRKAMRKAA